MNVDPDCVCNTELSRISLRNWICGASSEPNAAVEIKHQPPPCCRSATQRPFFNTVPGPQTG